MRCFRSLLVVVLFGCWLTGCNVTARRTFQEYVAVDGSGPSGLAGHPWNGQDAVVLYRTGRNDVVCFDAFHSKDLHNRLSAKNGKLITVEFDTFRDFGKVRGYNVHSVDGIIVANGDHVLRDDFASSGGAYSTREGTSSGDDCW